MCLYGAIVLWLLSTLLVDMTYDSGENLAKSICEIGKKMMEVNAGR